MPCIEESNYSLQTPQQLFAKFKTLRFFAFQFYIFLQERKSRLIAYSKGRLFLFFRRENERKYSKTEFFIDFLIKIMYNYSKTE